MRTLNAILAQIELADQPSAPWAHVVSEIAASTQADVCSIYAVDERQGEYVLLATQGLPGAVVGKTRLHFGTGLVGLVGERGEVVSVAEAHLHPHFEDVPQIDETALNAFLGVPIVYRSEALGVLVLQRETKEVFSTEIIAELVTLATQLGEALAKANAKGELQSCIDKGRKQEPEKVLMGVSGAPGIAIGEAVLVFPPADIEAVPDREIKKKEIAAETALFKNALLMVREEINDLKKRAHNVLSLTEQTLFDAYLHILDSRSLMNAIEKEIHQGQWAQGAVKYVIKQHILQFESLDDPYLRERASDFRDLGRRLLAQLQANNAEKTEYPEHTILVSEEVTATALMEVPQGRLKGVVSASGSTSSHVAILTRAMGVPTAMAVMGAHLSQLNSKELIVDGYNGHVYVSPPASVKKEFQQLALEEAQLDAELETLRDQPAETLDGHRINLYVNTGLAIDSAVSLSVGAEGVGLYRSELPFMVRSRFPSEDEQYTMYRQLLATFAPRPVIMRTLDIGGDKALPYFPMEESNPFLGWRGIRVTLDHPEIFLQQVRAMLKASVELNNLSIMIPMITSVNEVEASLSLIRQAYDELTEEGLEVAMPRLGIMIEVPAAVYQAHVLAKRVDFLSVGSNDLVQYLLAVDRNNARVAHCYDSLHPAVIQALQLVVRGGHKANKPVSICGEMAADPLAVILLVAMGFDSLSISANSLSRIKWAIRRFSLDSAKELLQEVLKMDDGIEVRCHLKMTLEEAGLGALIRAGT